MRSIEGQNYPHRIIVGNDSDDSYCAHYQPIRYGMQTSNRRYLDLKNYKTMHFPYNTYINRLMKEVKEGWVMILDDDNALTPGALERIGQELTEENRVVFWRVNICGQPYPSDKNWRKRPQVKDIDMGGFCFHSKYIPLCQFDPYKQADYRVADRLYSILNPVWINEVLVRAQREEWEGSGLRMDKQTI